MKWLNLRYLKIFIVSIVIVLPYIYAMAIHPFIVGGWPRLHKVWFDWQTFNSAMIALLAAFIGVITTIYITKSQSRSQFMVARAHLPEALAAVGGYLDQYMLVLNEAFKKLNSEGVNRQSLTTRRPELDNDYKVTFGNCIAYGSDDIRNVIVDITKKIQIHKARLSHLVEKQFTPDTKEVVLELNVISELKSVCYTRAQINLLYEYARFKSEYVNTSITNKDIMNAALKLDGNIIDRLNTLLSNAE